MDLLLLRGASAAASRLVSMSTISLRLRTCGPPWASPSRSLDTMPPSKSSRSTSIAFRSIRWFRHRLSPGPARIVPKRENIATAAGARQGQPLPAARTAIRLKGYPPPAPSPTETRHAPPPDVGRRAPVRGRRTRGRQLARVPRPPRRRPRRRQGPAGPLERDRERPLEDAGPRQGLVEPGRLGRTGLGDHGRRAGRRQGPGLRQGGQGQPGQEGRSVRRLPGPQDRPRAARPEARVAGQPAVLPPVQQQRLADAGDRGGPPVRPLRRRARGAWTPPPARRSGSAAT